ncbi:MULTISPECIES: Na+/H+ antiporter subunit E [Actinoalloteichus]|uniref:Na+/H+ ion antiporter subunit n=1 Tax=Actinoalloteichus fjordicus TaxID=1612552 RepID=A0AAC9LFD7_9PSEU|nr:MULTISPECIES: Na+/H+ antiporter subunit E [Actinoalloteichus]APU15855.1 Na+/H+ ion antiporter subunit [Actinoalloteichus fjordicus]APU21917.1 Na+/H+ ion antiporter subunit [Actinoalloteichus sp. GBA129-24]
MTSQLRWLTRLLRFPFYYALEVVKSSTTVALDILTPGSRATPAFVEVRLRCTTDLEITMLANMISLTPGTVTVATRRRPATLWVHGMYVDDRESFREELYAMEDRLLAVTRRNGAPDRLPASRRTTSGGPA